MENDDWLEQYIKEHGVPHDYDGLHEMLHEYQAYLEAAKSSEQPVDCTAATKLARDTLRVALFHASQGHGYDGAKLLERIMQIMAPERESVAQWKPLSSAPKDTPLWLTADGSDVHTGYVEASGDFFQCFHNGGSEICGVQFWMRPILLPTNQIEADKP
jgi:hypothetical protein